MSDKKTVALDSIPYPLLLGVVGSTTYGLATEHSDVDRLGIFAHPTEVFFGLGKPPESYVDTDPDHTMHEAAKALRLILSCNPTATEILWLERYEVSTHLGLDLVDLRSSLLSAKAVRNAYLGYATQQFRKLQAREVTGTSTPSRIQSAKHARHLIRLLLQGTGLHTTGELIIHLENPEDVRSIGELIAADPDKAKGWMAWAEAIFDVPGVLPEFPDVAAAEAWLKKVRYACLDDSNRN